MEKPPTQANVLTHGPTETRECSRAPVHRTRTLGPPRLRQLRPVTVPASLRSAPPAATSGAALPGGVRLQGRPGRGLTPGAPRIAPRITPRIAVKSLLQTARRGSCDVSSRLRAARRTEGGAELERGKFQHLKKPEA